MEKRETHRPDSRLARRVVGPLRRGRVLMLAGAGISAASGLPLGVDLVRWMLLGAMPAGSRRLADAVGSVTQPRLKLRPEVLLEIVVRRAGAHALRALNAFNAAVPAPAHYFVGEAALRGSAVTTTNFDILIERAIAELEATHSEAQAGGRTPVAAAYPVHVLKLHGSLASVKHTRAAGPLAAALSQVARGLPRSTELSLRSHLQGRMLLCLGYSGNDAFDIVPLFERARPQQPVVWVQHEPGRWPPRWEEAVDSSINPTAVLLATWNSRVWLLRVDTERLIQDLGARLGWAHPPPGPRLLNIDRVIISWMKRHLSRHAQYMILGDAVSQSGRPREARIAYRQALSQAANANQRAAALEALGWLYYRHLSRLQTAHAYFRAALVRSRGQQRRAIQRALARTYMYAKRDPRRAREQLLAALRGCRDSAERSALENATGNLAFETGELALAATHYRRGLRAAGRHSGAAFVTACRLHHNLALTLERQRHVTRATVEARLALRGWETVGDPAGVAGCLSTLAGLARVRGDLTDARRLRLRALRLWRQAREPDEEVREWNNLGILDLYQGSWKRAVRHHEAALVQVRRRKDRREIGMTCAFLARALGEGGQWRRGRSFLLKAMTLAAEDPSPSLGSEALSAWELIGGKRVSSLLTLVRQAERSSSPRVVALGLRVRSRLAIDTGKYSDGLKLARRALAHLRQQPDAADEGSAWILIARANVGLRHNRLALEAGGHARDCFERSKYRPGIRRARHLLEGIAKGSLH